MNPRVEGMLELRHQMVSPFTDQEFEVRRRRVLDHRYLTDESWESWFPVSTLLVELKEQSVQCRC